MGRSAIAAAALCAVVCACRKDEAPRATEAEPQKMAMPPVAMAAPVPPPAPAAPPAPAPAVEMAGKKDSAKASSPGNLAQQMANLPDRGSSDAVGYGGLGLRGTGAGG